MRALLVPLALLAAGCVVVGPDHEPPERPLPAAWSDAPAAQAGLAAGEADVQTWWRRFDDPVLEALVEEALASGLDVREALGRIAEARALRGVAAGELWPDLDAVAAYERSQLSQNTPFGALSGLRTQDLYSAGFDATWELDLWGRVRRSVEAADAELDATVEDARDVAVTVAAETAATYVDLRSLQRRVALALQNVALQEQTLELVRARYEAGLVDERDLAQAATNLESTRSLVPRLRTAQRAAEHRLSVLLARAPGDLPPAVAEPAAIPSGVPVPPAEVAVGVPADLLRRRADVRRAERRLAVETALVGVAEGDLYPRLALNGRIGFESIDADELFEDASGVFGVGPSIRWNLFDAGRTRNRVRAQEARREQARLRWERTVLVALEEVENAMHSYAREQERRAALREAVVQARRAVELSQAQYDGGLADFQAVLDSQRQQTDLEDELAASDAAVTTDVVALYKALGGGWRTDAEDALAAADAPAP